MIHILSMLYSHFFNSKDTQQIIYGWKALHKCKNSSSFPLFILPQEAINNDNHIKNKYDQSIRKRMEVADVVDTVSILIDTAINNNTVLAMTNNTTMSGKKRGSLPEKKRGYERRIAKQKQTCFVYSLCDIQFNSRLALLLHEQKKICARKEAAKNDNGLLDQCFGGIHIAIKSQVNEEKQSSSNNNGNKNTNDHDSNDTAPMTKLLQGIVRISSTEIWQAQMHSVEKTRYIGVWDKPHDAAREYMLAKEQLQQFSKLEAAAKLKAEAKFEADRS